MIGVVADDITGAGDIGIMFAKADIATHVYAHRDYDPAEKAVRRPGAVVLDTNSRLDDRDTAYGKVFEATKALREAGAKLFIKKTCSVFRGNVGAECDAMLDALGEDFAVVVLGFPKNGRTTVNGIHYVHGVPLEQSEFRRDPAHPMAQSRLADILRGQTRRKVDLLDYRAVDSGPDELRERIRAKRGSCGYLILDVRDQRALRTIAQAVRGEFVLCGSSALAEELPPAVEFPRGERFAPGIPRREGTGILCTAGSLMPQTAAQIAHVREQGMPVFELDTRELIQADARTALFNRLADALADCLTGGRDAVLHASNDPALVAETKKMGAAAGLADPDISRLVTSGLAEVASRTIGRTGQNRLLVAGGETSAAVCARMGIAGMRVWREIEPGLPSCLTLADPPMLLVLKSGSFGSRTFFTTALEHLRNQP